MPWLLVMACALGVLLGLSMRVSSIVATSGVLLLFGPVVLGLMGWSPWTVIGYVFVLLIALQAGYLIGVCLSLPRVSARDHVRLSRDSTQTQQP
jgi:hypothetical protein